MQKLGRYVPLTGKERGTGRRKGFGMALAESAVIPAWGGVSGCVSLWQVRDIGESA